MQASPGLAEKIVDESGDIGDIHHAVTVAVSLLVIYFISQQHIDKSSHISNVHHAVTVDVATIVFRTVGKQGDLLAVAALPDPVFHQLDVQCR